MLSSNLEKTLRNAYQLATNSKHEFVTLEHLLKSLTDDKDALSVLKACGVEIEELKNNLEEFIKNDLSNLTCLLYTSPSPRDATLSRMPSSA